MVKTGIILFWIHVAWVLTSGFVYAGERAEEKYGLVIVSHGSPSSQWNVPLIELEEEVKEVIGKRSDNPFKEIRIAFMEFVEPSINTVIMDLDSRGVDRIYVLPLFIAPSEHTLYDLPAILGLYSEKKKIEELREEGIALVDTKTSITIGAALNTSDVLKKIMLKRVKELSTDPLVEGVVLLAHGSDSFEPIWSSMCREIGSHICAEMGIDYYDYAFVGIGQSFITEGASVVLQTAEQCGRTIVVGIYVSMGVEDMANHSVLGIGRMEMKSKEMFAGKNIVFSKRGLLPDQGIAAWIADEAMEWAVGLRSPQETVSQK